MDQNQELSDLLGADIVMIDGTKGSELFNRQFDKLMDAFEEIPREYTDILCERIKFKYI